MTSATIQPSLFDTTDILMPIPVPMEPIAHHNGTDDRVPTTIDSAAAPLPPKPVPPVGDLEHAVGRRAPGPVRATTTRKKTEVIMEKLQQLEPERRRPQPRRNRGVQALPPELAHLASSSGDLTLQRAEDGWQAYLLCPRGNNKPGTNADRGVSDLGNKRRALMDVALGHSGHEDLFDIPLTMLARDLDALNADLLKGTTTRLGHAPDSKKASNLRSDLKSVRAALEGLLELPALGPKAALQRRTVQKGRWQKGILTSDWPAPLYAEVQAMCTAYSSGKHVGPGEYFFRKHRKRPATLANLITRLNRVVDYLLHVERLPSPRLVDLVDLTRLPHFKDWYFEQVTEGGYDSYRHICSALVNTALYLEAIGTLNSGFSIDSKDPAAPWMQFSEEGRLTFDEGLETNQKVSAEEIPIVTPEKLRLLAHRCRVQPPLTVDGRAPSSRQIFQRLFAAVFFGVGIYMPLRGRNWREMKWGQNLFRKADGSWHVKFSGNELKNGTIGGKIRKYVLKLPKEAADWIEWWRAQLQIFVGNDFERQCPFVFPMLSTLTDEHNNYRWTPMSVKYLLRCVDDAALEGIDQRFRPHMIRHCVATAIVSGGRVEDAQQAATLLGDTLKTVLDKYFKPDEQALLDSGYYARLTVLPLST